MLVAKIINQSEIEVLHCINNTQIEELKHLGYMEYIQDDKTICIEGDKETSNYQVIDNKIVQCWSISKDNQAIINELKEKLSKSDYKIIKCMEAQLTGNAFPYDVELLHLERQQVRDRINELEELILTEL